MALAIPRHDFSGCRIKKGQPREIGERDRRKRTRASASPAANPARRRIIPCKWIMPPTVLLAYALQDRTPTSCFLSSSVLDSPFPTVVSHGSFVAGG